MSIDKENKNGELFKLSYMLLGYMFLSVFLFIIFKIFKYQGSLILFQILSVSIPLIIYIILSKNSSIFKKILLCIVYLFIIIALPFAFGRTYDLTVDGNSYHKTAIGYLKEGWNPIYESSADFHPKTDLPKIERVDLWMDHYPKATWIISANIYSMTGNIESGKSLTSISIIILFLLLYSFLSNIINKKKALLISIATLFNPIIISQVFNYYVDGLMGIYFACQIVVLSMIKPQEKKQINLWIVLAMLISMFVNLKFTGLVYSGIISAVFYFYWLIKYRKDKVFKNITIKFVIIYIVAIILFGAPSYIKNTIDHKNPFFPLMGENKVDIVTTMQPKSFENISTIEKFAISLFSKTENVTHLSGVPKLKIPFTVYKSEIDNLFLPDTRIGGFGPWFGIILIFSILCGLFLIPFAYRESKKLIYLLPVVLSILISVAILKENWWARYIPQFYLIPIIILFLLAFFSDKLNNFRHIRMFKTLFAILFIMISINFCFFAYSKKIELTSFIQIRKDLNIMANTNDLKLQLSDETLYGLYYNLKDYNIKYKYQTEIKEENIRYMYSWRLKVDNDA